MEIIGEKLEKKIKNWRLLEKNKLRESNKIEFKTGKDKIPLSLYETFSSFLNTLGGTIYLGIEEENGIPKIVGINNAVQKKSLDNC